MRQWSVKLRLIWQDRDRHGNLRTYFARRGQRKVRIYETLGTPEFNARYYQILEQSERGELEPKPDKPAITPGTLRFLCAQYFNATNFTRLDPSTQRVRRRVLESIRQEPLYQGASEVFGDFPLARLDAKSLRVLRDRKAKLPAAANYRVKCLGSF